MPTSPRPPGPPRGPLATTRWSAGAGRWTSAGSPPIRPPCGLAGRTDLRELAEVVAGAGAVVAGDTGVAHLATAFGKPSVTLFGPTPPALWGPPAAWRDRHVALWKGTTGDPHAGALDPGLLRIEPEEVIAALRRLL